MLARNLLIKGFIVGLLAITLTACGTYQPPNAGGTDSLEQLCALSGSPTNVCKNTTSSIRLQALQETAMCIGAQAGLAWRAKQINCILNQNSKSLDRIFDFNLMLLPHNVLPPVLDEGEQILNLDDPQTIRIADRTYKIISQARFVTTAPNWRDYLWLTYTCPEVPIGTLLPQNCDERKIWCCYATQGWQQGVTQANQIYAANLARIRRDFTGMVRYRVLLDQHMVSPPFVARTDLGITGSCSDMRINDQVLRITALPCLQTNSKRWRAIVDAPCCGAP